MRVTLHSSRVIFYLINREKTCQNRRQSWMARINIPSRSLSDPGFRGDFHSWGENENVTCAIDRFCQTFIFEVHLQRLLIFQFRLSSSRGRQNRGKSESWLSTQQGNFFVFNCKWINFQLLTDYKQVNNSKNMSQKFRTISNAVTAGRKLNELTKNQRNVTFFMEQDGSAYICTLTDEEKVR